MSDKEGYLLELQNVNKTFPGVKALDAISLQVSSGEVHAILGENGAGKSTLMNILYGFYQPTGGYILWQGEECKLESPLKARDIGIAMVHQESMLLQHMDVASNVFLGQYDQKAGFVQKEKLRNRTRKLIEQLDIKGISPDDPVYRLSAAQQKMIEIVAALARSPKCLLLDEPSASLTEREIDTLFTVIRRLKEQGVAILYISHRLEEIFEIADRITILRDGKLVVSGDIQNFTMDSIISNMVGRTLNEQMEKLEGDRKEALPGDTVIEVKSLSQGRRFQNIGFTVRKGEIFGISGLVGSGRSELLEAIFGFSPADSGEIYVNGQRININRPTDALKQGIALIPEERQSKSLFLYQNILDNTTIAVAKKYQRIGILNKKQMVKDANDAVERFKIKTPGIYKLVGELSGGNQQKCIVARWLLTNPSILMMDEPTHGIDVGTKAEIYQIMRDLTNQGITIIFVSSELNELLVMADRIMVMHEGHQMGIVERKDFSQEKIIAMASGLI